MDGYQVARLESVVHQVDVLITATGNVGVVSAADLMSLKNQAIVGNVGHFDNEIDLEALSRHPGVVKNQIKPNVHEWLLPDGKTILVLSEGRLMNLGNATGHPSFVMSMSFSNQVLAQIELFNSPDQYPLGVHLLPKHLDEKVARLHLEAIGVELTELSEEQAAYIGVEKSGPFKLDHYRY
jgi:adenosylhomocysteinase